MKINNLLIYIIMFISIFSCNYLYSMMPQPAFSINSIEKLEINSGNDTVFAFIKIGKEINNDYLFEFNYLSPFQNDLLNLTVYSKSGDFIFHLDSIEGIHTSMSGIGIICPQIITSKNFIIINSIGKKHTSLFTIYNIKNQKLTYNHFDCFYNYVGKDSSRIYFSKKSVFVENVIPEIFYLNSLGEFNKLETTLTSTDIININDSTNMLYYDSKYFIAQERIDFPKFQIMINIQNNNSLILNSVLYLLSNLFYKYNDNLIMMGFNLKKQNLPELTAKIINRPYNKIIQLNSNGETKILFDSFDYFSKNDPHSLNYEIQDFKVVDDFLIINFLGFKSCINNKEFNNGLLIFDLKTNELITKPIKYIDTSDEKK